MANANAIERADYITDEMLAYLDSVRESDKVNMYGAGIYLTWEFPELNKREARGVLAYWMKTFEVANA